MRGAARTVVGVSLALVSLGVAAGCSSDGGGNSLEVVLVAEGAEGAIEVTATVDGEAIITTEPAGSFRRELTIEGGFDVEIVAVSVDGATVECAILGLDEPREVKLNPSLGRGDSVELSGEPRVEGVGGVRCSASGSIDSGSVNYRSETEILG